MASVGRWHDSHSGSGCAGGVHPRLRLAVGDESRHRERVSDRREIVIKVFVERKRPPADVPPGQMIPSAFEGVPTDVVEIGVPKPFVVPGAVAPESMPMDDTHTGPVRGGASLAREMPRGGGTLGCILGDSNDATAIYALTSHQVVAPGGLSLWRRFLLEVAPGRGEVLGFPAAGADECSRAAVGRLEPGFKWFPAIKDMGVAAL